MKKIAMSLLTITAIVSLVAGATNAYFSDNATSYNNTFTAGTLNLQLSDANEGWSEAVSGTWNSPSNWAPGQEVDSTIHLRNAGSVPAEAVYAWWNNLRDPQGMSNVIEVTWLSDSTGINTNSIAPFVTAYDSNHDTKLSLAELVYGLSHYNSTNTPDPFQARFYADSNESYNTPVLAANGGTFDIKLKYKFMETAGNEYQGATCQFDLTFQAAQHHYVP